MALRDQPYLPLYIQDYLTDEKLNECCSSTQGIYVKIMCLMHKSETYGKILLKQKYKQGESESLNYGNQLANHLPFSSVELVEAIKELLAEKVCFLDGDYLCQKRMIRDDNLSIQRSEAGKKGGENTQKKKKDLAKAKTKANSENEDESEYENKDSKEWSASNEKFREFLCREFGISEMKQPQNYFLITKAINLKQNQGEENYSWFKGQCYIYFKYKEKSGEKKHGLKQFIGELEEIDKGGWNNENWDKKLQEAKRLDKVEPNAKVQPVRTKRLGQSSTLKEINSAK